MKADTPKTKIQFHKLARFMLLALPLALGTQAHAQPPAAKVILNGKVVGAYFNDGDSFRILKGYNKGAKARLAGFNTLESHGAVHQWGDWTSKEMYNLAQMATLNGRRGTWSCETDGKMDTYGRLLANCENLAVDQVRKGLAHAMSVNDAPAWPRVVAAQIEAMKEKRGMWAHGTPEFVLTSIHSAEEDIQGRGTYNRLVSTADGHSIMWKHNTKYQECENVCNMVFTPNQSVVPGVIAKLKATAPQLIEDVDDATLNIVINTYQRIRLVDRGIPKQHRAELHKLLSSYAVAGLFGTAAPNKGTCMIHIPFKRRYGSTRAKCLKK